MLAMVRQTCLEQALEHDCNLMNSVLQSMQERQIQDSTESTVHTICKFCKH